VAIRTLEKCRLKKMQSANLRNMRLAELPVDMAQLIPGLSTLTEMDLSKNQLFTIRPVFDMLSRLANLKVARIQCSAVQCSPSCATLISPLTPPLSDYSAPLMQVLNITENFLNGPMPASVAGLVHLEELYLDLNRVTSLPAECGAWIKVRIRLCLCVLFLLSP
jgi:Leucine-rich repeat (LRR) protein